MRFISNIKSINGYLITVEFDNEEIRLIDIKKFLNLDSLSKKSIFYNLTNLDYFNSLKIDSYGTLCWNDEIDFCPDVLYLNSYELE